MKKMIILTVLRILLLLLILLIFFLYFTRCSAPRNVRSEERAPEKFFFPDSFMFGVATSAFQNEGGFGKTDWDEWPAYKNGTHEHPGFGEADIALAAKFGMKYFRFSVEWALIEPEEGVWNEKELELLKTRTAYMKKCGIEPFFCFSHFTLSWWLGKRGGCENDSFPFFYNRYVRKVAEEIKPLGIKWFMTFNEPGVVITRGYIDGWYPPGKKMDFRAAKRVEKNLIRAHKLAYASLHEILDTDKEKINVGIADFTTRFAPYLSFLPNIASFKIENIIHEVDYIGLNYYGVTGAKVFGKKIMEFTNLTSPEGIYELVKDARKYKKPIIITENGVSDSAMTDKKRISFLLEHLKWLCKAAHEPEQEIAPLIGYFYWTFFDNFEWDRLWDANKKGNFGLVAVDSETKVRKPRLSAFLYCDIICANGITAEILEKYK